MESLFSTEHLDLLVSHRSATPRPGCTATVQHEVVDGPLGRRTYHLRYIDGLLVAARPGPADDADAVVTMRWDDAVKVATMELDLGAAFMQGRATVGGDVRALDALVPLLESAEHKMALAAVASRLSPNTTPD